MNCIHAVSPAARVKLRSEHSRIDGGVPAARVAALQHQRPRWDKSIGHEQGDQEAGRRRECNSESEGVAPE